MLAIVLACMAVAEAAPMCASGCEGQHSPVCGDDGFTYQSACVAECQGITVASQGPCGKVRGAFLKAHAKQITRGDMDRFKDEGFRLVGAAKSAVFDPEFGEAQLAADGEKLKQADKSQGNGVPPAGNAELTALRFTDDNLVYARPVPPPTTADFPPQAPTILPLEEDVAPTNEEEKTTAAERKLLTVLGTDTRTQETGYGGIPRSAGGKITYSVNGVGYMCSGAMISDRTVLTAAHCVFDRTKQVWASGVVFTPNQLSSTWKPYGSYGYSYLTTFTAYTSLSTTYANPWDIAAIRLVDQTVGQRTGYLGTMLPTNSWATTIYTEGYPGDKPSGTYWKTSCFVSDASRDGQILHTCDTYGGQSGSPVFTNNNYVLGVHSWGGSTTNGAAEFTSTVYSSVVSWR